MEARQLGLFDECEVISVYTREQAVDDGMLIDVTELAQEAGIKLPTVVGHELYYGYIDHNEDGQSTRGRLWDVLMMFSFAVKLGRIQGSCGTYTVLFVTKGQRENVEIWAEVGPGTYGEPVLTLCLPCER